MGIWASIKDGWGQANKLKVLGEGEVGVVVHTHPPVAESRIGLPFRQYFTLDGTPTGDNDMLVDGSGADGAIDFCIPANQEFDTYVKFIAIKLADAGAKLDKFGAITALTNGVAFEWKSQSVGAITIHDGIKDNLEFFRMSSVTPSIIDLSGGGADAIIVPIDLAKMFGSPWGIKLTKGTTEKLVFRVQDDIQAPDEFNIIGHGTKV